MSTTKRALSIQLQCSDFPGIRFCDREPIYLSVQKNQDVIWPVPGDSKEVTYDIPLFVNEGKNGKPNFLGPFVFGKTGDKFLYLVWYSKKYTIENRFRRIKIKLNVLTWEDINQAILEEQPMVAHIKLKDKRGEPVCASLKEGNIGWQVRR